MRSFECEVTVPTKELEHYQEILDKDINYFIENDEEFPIDATLFSVEGTFKNGWSAKYEVFTGCESVMSSCYLYDENGDEVAFQEDDCSIVSTTQFCIEDDMYVFVIYEEGTTPVYAVREIF